MGFGIQSVFGDTYNSLGMVFKSEPTVCIFEPHPSYTTKSSEIMLAAENSVQLWEDVLHEYSPNGNWNFDVFTVPIEYHHTEDAYAFPSCDILIAFEFTNDTYALGYTHMNFSKSWHKYSQSTIFLNAIELTPIIEKEAEGNGSIMIGTKLSISELAIPVIQNIITHEFGHALGLGHYNITDYPIYTDDRPWQEASVMYYSLDEEDEELTTPTYVDIMMLEKLYYYDGFGGTPVTNIPKVGYYSPGDEDICTFKCKVWQ